MKTNQIILPVIFLLFGCHNEKGDVEKWKGEILEAEKNFAEMAESRGIEEAFLAYAAEDAVLMRNNKLVIGKTGMAKYFREQSLGSKGVTLTWKPDFVDVSRAGDLGYTYGYYEVSYPDSSGSVTENKGVFHTVWRRQGDGSWKFVWD